MRNVVAGLGAVLVLATAVGVGWWLLEGGGPFGEDEPGDTAEASLEAYLAAWQQGADLEMAEHVRDASETFVEVHEQLRDALDAQSLHTDVLDLTEPEDGRAIADIELVWEVEYTDALGWEVEVELQRAQGEWAVAWSPAAIHVSWQPGLVFDVEISDVERAPILADDGSELAGEGERVVLGFEPGAVDDAEELIAAFDQALDAGDAAERELGRDELVDDWFYPVTTVSEEEGADAWDELGEVAGALQQATSGRTLLEDGFARHVVGEVAEATAEQLEELGEPYEAGDEVGQFGLEATFERSLVGSDEVAVLLRDGENGPVRDTVLEHQAEPSDPLPTTIDVAVQRAVENALVGVETTAAIVVVDAEDGAIRGSASRPLGEYNRAFSGSYAPGSTFKLVTLEALLADGMDPDDEVDCPADTSVGGLTITNAGDLDLGTTTLREAFADSCNTTFAPLGVELGSDALIEAAERFGFGWDPDLGISADGSDIAEPEDDAALGASAFGQARVVSTPLHLASVAAATDTGRWHAPYLLPDHESDEEPRDLADDVLDDLQDLLREVVADGTGTEADTHDEVRGKTGTAEAGEDIEHAWFIGTFEGLGFAVLVEEGGAGGAVAAPVAGRLVSELDTLLDEPDPADDDEDAADEDADGEDADDEDADDEDADDEDADDEDAADEDADDADDVDGDGDDEE